MTIGTVKVKIKSLCSEIKLVKIDKYVITSIHSRQAFRLNDWNPLRATAHISQDNTRNRKGRGKGILIVVCFCWLAPNQSKLWGLRGNQNISANTKKWFPNGAFYWFFTRWCFLYWTLFPDACITFKSENYNVILPVVKDSFLFCFYSLKPCQRMSVSRVIIL